MNVGNMTNENTDDDLFEDMVDESTASSGTKIEIELPEGGSQDLMEQVKDAEGRALRAQAELENFRIRVRREMDDQLKFSNQKLMTDQLPVIDNLYRAVAAASSQNEQQTGGLLEGVLMVAQQLLDTLRQHHCTRIEAVGSPFDPNLHEAISQMPSDEHAAGDVMQVVQEGYQLHDRVIRPAHVIISTGPAEGGSQEG